MLEDWCSILLRVCGSFGVFSRNSFRFRKRLWVWLLKKVLDRLLLLLLG